MAKEIISDNIKLEYETADEEANNLLKNGILVETPKGLICMSVNDALSSDLNLSAEQLQKLAVQLLLLQGLKQESDNSSTKRNFQSDSDGFSSECSDVCSTSSRPLTMVPPNSVTLSSTNSKSESPESTNLSHSVSLSELSTNSCISDSDVSVCNIDGKTLNSNSAVSESSSSLPSETKSNVDEHKPPKRRGGWPKGRKRKPELLNLPPKAPATGYNLFLNEQRKFYKDSSLAFPEITKIIGNRWSNLSLEAKKPYLMKAEEDKKRYKEELKAYRQSDAYRAYLAKKRQKRLQNNILSESDMDATDEIDDEDNEELYCRTCDQWFHNLHNKREHLQGKQHIHSVAGDIKRELESDVVTKCKPQSVSLKQESVDDISDQGQSNAKQDPVTATIVNLISLVANREKEMKMLENRLKESVLMHDALCQQLASLRERENKLKNDLINLKKHEREIENTVFKLWKVPSLFIVTDFNELY